MLLLKVLKVLDNVISLAYMTKSNMLLASEKSFVYLINKNIKGLGEVDKYVNWLLIFIHLCYNSIY